VYTIENDDEIISLNIQSLQSDNSTLPITSNPSIKGLVLKNINSKKMSESIDSILEQSLI